MKPVISVFAFLVVCLIMVSSCKTKTVTKPDPIQELQSETMTLLLKDGKTEKYITKTYADYKPSAVKRSNRTLNQYRATFTCTEKDLMALRAKLEADPEVLEASTNAQGSIDIQSGSNQKSGKAKPGKNH